VSVASGVPAPPDDLAYAADPAVGGRRLVPWRRAPFPAPWEAWFGRAAPLHLEIGFGDGRYTVRHASDRPGHDFVGVEVSGVSVRRALAKARRRALPNVRLVKAPAPVAIRQLFGSDALTSITVNFPDPWPKDRHAGRRLLRRPFLALAADRLAPDGEIRLATDHPDYLAFALAEVEASGLYRVEWPAPPPAVFETKYALKWRDQGKPLHYAVFVRNDRPAPPHPPLERPDVMPHALIRGAPDHGAAFEKHVLAYGDGHVVLHEMARSVGGDRGERRLLVRATVDEPDLTQQVLVVVQHRHDDQWIVRLESFGDPIVTAAVRGAVHAVTDWLERHGEVRVEARNY
jgi:tRNA (guanine-N7-)-methyltransferase